MIKRTTKIFLEVALALLAGLVIITGLFLWRLSEGPVRLDFLTPYLESSFSDAERGYTVRVAETVLSLDREEADLDLRALNIAVRDLDEQPIATLPNVEVSFSLRALLSGVLAPTKIELVGAWINLVRTLEGDFDIGGIAPKPPTAEAAPKETADLSSVIPDLLQELQSTPDPGRQLSFLRQVDIVDGQVLIRDLKTGIDWWAQSATIEIRRDQVGLEGRMALDIAQPKQIAGIEGTFSFHAESERLDLVVNFDSLQPSDFALAVPQLEALQNLEIPLAGSILAAIDSDGAIRNIAYEFSGDAGQVRLPELFPKPLQLQRLSARGAFDRAADRASLERAEIVFGSGEAKGPSITISAKAEELSADIKVSAEAAAENVVMNDLADYWPTGLNDNARDWVTENVRDGIAERAEVKVLLTLPGGDPEALEVGSVSGNITYSNISAHYLRPLPPVVGINGEADFDASTFSLSNKSGSLGNLVVPAGQVTITGLDAEDQDIDIDLLIMGPLLEGLELLDHERLDLLRKIDIDPSQASGEAIGRLRLKFPLLADLDIDDIIFDARFEAEGAAIRDVVAERDVTEARLTLKLTNEQMRVVGPAKFGGVPLEIEWTEFFGDGVSVSSELVAKVPLATPLDLASYGLPVEPFLSGPVSGLLTTTIDRDGVIRMKAELDLERAHLTFPILAWEKPAGLPGTAVATIVFKDEALQSVEAFEIYADTLEARGAVDFTGPDAEFARLTLDRLAFDRTVLERVVATPWKNGLRVQVSEGVVDLAPKLSEPAAAAADDQPEAVEPDTDDGDGEGVAFDLSAPRLQRVYFGTDEYLEDVFLHLVRLERGWDRIEIRGRVPEHLARHPKAKAERAEPEEKPSAKPEDQTTERSREAVTRAPTQAPRRTPGPPMLTFDYAPIDSGVRRLNVQATDMGAVLRATDTDPNVDGGYLEITGETASSDPLSPLKGQVEGDGFRIHDAPILAQLLTLASLTGIVEALDGGGLVFDRITGDFEFDFENNAISTELVRIYGTSIGITTQGTVDLGNDHVKVRGVVVPAYFLNRILGAIPIVGRILTGGEGEGLIAFTYKVDGPATNPEVSVNPLSGLAPGFLRGVFNIFESDGDGADSERPEPAALPDDEEP